MGDRFPFLVLAASMVVVVASFVKDNLLGTRWECLECSVLVRNPQRHADFHTGLRMCLRQAMASGAPGTAVDGEGP